MLRDGICNRILSLFLSLLKIIDEKSILLSHLFVLETCFGKGIEDFAIYGDSPFFIPKQTKLILREKYAYEQFK